MSPSDAAIKRGFDLALSIFLLPFVLPLIGVGWLVSSLDTGKNGFFLQARVGQNGRRFDVIKLRTMKSIDGLESTTTVTGDPRITRVGRLQRKLKVDELPQLLNVIMGHMSFVGPRPDVPGYADELRGGDRLILTIRPGITGPATLKYRHEEALLAAQDDPEVFSREIIYPDKVKTNLEYIRTWSLSKDLRYIAATLIPSTRKP